MSDLVCLKSVSYPRALYDNKSHYRNEYQDVNPICYIAFCITVKSALISYGGFFLLSTHPHC